MQEKSKCSTDSNSSRKKAQKGERERQKEDSYPCPENVNDYNRICQRKTSSVGLKVFTHLATCDGDMLLRHVASCDVVHSCDKQVAVTELCGCDVSHEFNLV